jgi:hypothetical protein
MLGLMSAMMFGLKGSEHADLADEFVASVCSGAGHKVLMAAGFGTP